jgi:hypothetical protein
MAKLSANGCHEIGKVTLRSGTGLHVFALRSDGKVLHRLAGFYNEWGEYIAHTTTYSVYASLKLAQGNTHYGETDVFRMQAILVKRGYEAIS